MSLSIAGVRADMIYIKVLVLNIHGGKNQRATSFIILSKPS